MTDTKLKVNTRGLTCPLPVLRVKKALKEIDAGELVELVSTDPQSVDDLNAFCDQAGHKIIDTFVREFDQEDGQSEYVFIIRKH